MSKLTVKKSQDPTLIQFVAENKLTRKTHVFNNMEEAQVSPLAQHLFNLPFVKSMVISDDYIVLERTEIVTWDEVQHDLKQIIEAYLSQGKPVISDVKKENIQIYVEETPNPDTLKFVTNRFLSKNPIQVNGLKEAGEIPLAFELFEYPFVRKVFISQNFISITKDKVLEWYEVSEPIREFLLEYLDKKDNVISRDKYDTLKDHGKTGDTEKQIKSLIEQYIKPAVARDGGNIKFENFDPVTKTVNVTLQGACNGCPSADITLKNGIEATLKQFLGDQIGSVKSLN